MPSDLEEVEGAATHPIDQELTRLWLQNALGRLPETLRLALMLVKAEGLTHREAAEVLQVPLGTVQFRVHEAMKRMRVILGEEATSPFFGLAVPITALEHELQRWANVSAPASLAARISGALQAAPPAIPTPRTEAGGPASGHSAPAGPAVRPIFRRTAAATAIVATLGALLWGFRHPASPPPPRAVQDVCRPWRACERRMPVGTYTQRLIGPGGSANLQRGVAESLVEHAREVPAPLPSTHRFRRGNSVG